MKKALKFDLSELKKDPLFTAAWEDVLAREKEHAKKTYEITFSVGCSTMFGESVIVVGNREFLGNWDPDKGVQLQWGPGDIWQAIACFRDNLASFEYKYLTVGKGETRWEGGKNRVAFTSTEDKRVVIARTDVWQRS